MAQTTSSTGNVVVTVTEAQAPAAPPPYSPPNAASAPCSITTRPQRAAIRPATTKSFLPTWTIFFTIFTYLLIGHGFLFQKPKNDPKCDFMLMLVESMLFGVVTVALYFENKRLKHSFSLVPAVLKGLLASFMLLIVGVYWSCEGIWYGGAVGAFLWGYGFLVVVLQVLVMKCREDMRKGTGTTSSEV